MKLTRQPAIADRLRFTELPDDVVLTPAEVGAWLQLSPRQVLRCRIPFLDLGKKSRRFRAGDVRAFLARIRREAAA